MCKLNSKLLLLCLLPLAMAGITSFWDMNPTDSPTLDCLRNSGYLAEAFTLTVFYPQENRWKVATSPLEILKAGTRTHLVVSTASIEGRLSPQLEARRLALQFATSPLLKIWVSISNFPGSFKPTCSYLRSFVRALHMFSGREVGFQSEPMFWEDLFGDVSACSELGQYDLYLSFNSFKPFGGWRNYSYFETYRPVPVCDYPGMEVFKH